MAFAKKGWIFCKANKGSWRISMNCGLLVRAYVGFRSITKKRPATATAAITTATTTTFLRKWQLMMGFFLPSLFWVVPKLLLNSFFAYVLRQNCPHFQDHKLLSVKKKRIEDITIKIKGGRGELTKDAIESDWVWDFLTINMLLIINNLIKLSFTWSLCTSDSVVVLRRHVNCFRMKK